MTVLQSSTVMVVVLVEGLSTSSSSSSSTKKSSTIIYSSTDIPPLVDVPVWSMATLNNDSDTNTTTRTTTNMNIITYVTPISIRPNRLYAVGLFKKTLSRENFLREKTCILQLLCDSTEHISCVKLLGGQSGYDLQKQNVLEQEESLNNDHGIGIGELQDLTSSASSSEVVLPKVLPGCVQYLKLSLVGDDIIEYEDGEEESSSHDIVICKVDEMWTTTTSTSTSSVEGKEVVVEGEPKKQQQKQQYLSTGRLRELGIITEQGRIAITATE
ncbi:hypothetical protein FRACYDRAFT_252749 [Fragilariopsis cylindrus CCMP1102]|uniref:Uncharacterized protein n=1 Tax=Fragilariopsis cylindrus CCMP1102 TaxID=635003 RepID=A0A1E7EM01_9STRA|nr:hypothetical protein FRACYDRAFT_252749 [Fragilariopsis cylindrus CCMP1102]|eukprot:OEU06867.1 hypothetical protein FRACYDRAFT_252749 [Fragilariopsis cylindrus CCMP1102]